MTPTYLLELVAEGCLYQWLSVIFARSGYAIDLLSYLPELVAEGMAFCHICQKVYCKWPSGTARRLVGEDHLCQKAVAEGCPPPPHQPG